MTVLSNEFSAGLDRDSSKNKYDNRHYYDANNVRILTQDGLSSGALEDMEGTIKRLDLSNVNGTAGAIPIEIIGYCVVRDNIILFLTENIAGPPDPAGANDFIIKVPIEEIESLTGTNFYTPAPGYESAGGSWIYRNALGFSRDYPIQCVGRYENQYVQKVYWVDGYNRLRYLNIVYDEETNDLHNIPPDRLEVLGDIELTRPELIDMGAGNLKSGRIQYAYQLYTLNGGETVFSPTGNLINLTEDSDLGYTDKDYRGSEIDVNTGKATVNEIEIESDYYTRIRVVAIHYSALNLEPEVRIVKEESIPGAGTYQFVDTGESFGSLTLAELRLLQTTLFSAEVIETKDNILFAGNVIVEDFDVDYDARAYRFSGWENDSLQFNYNAIYGAAVQGSQVARIYDSDLVSYYEIDDSGNVTASGLPVVATWDLIDEEFDAINRFNDLDNDGDHNFRFMYQSDGETVGGEGPNVEYRIRRAAYADRLRIDITGGGGYYYYSGADLVGDQRRFSSYKSVWEAGENVSYQRDETYRFGIVFFDDKGRSSFVKWIGDIRMPSMSTDQTPASPYKAFDNDVPGLDAYPMWVEFTIKNIPTEAVSFQIVRVRRDGGDRSILAQGIAMPTAGAVDTFYHQEWGATNTTQNTVQFHSPEVSFNKNLSTKGNDFLQVIGTTLGSVTQKTIEPPTPAANRLKYYKYDDPSVLSGQSLPSGASSSGDEFHSDSFADVTEGHLIRQTDIAKNFSIGDSYTVNNTTNKTDKGICYLIPGVSYYHKDTEYNLGIPILNYRRNVFTTQYGGYDYNARSVSEYMACSDVYDRDSTNPVTAESRIGDTYLVTFEFMWNARENEVALTEGVLPEVISFPVESSINVGLRLDEPYTEQSGLYESIFLHDEAGIYADGDISEGTQTYTLFQYEDQYRYNTVYSKENDTKLFIPRPFDWRQLTDIDVRVYASDMKINGEPSDSWLKFRSDQFIEVDPQYGPLTALKTVTNQLFFFQPKAFGVLSVNERALIQTGDTAAQLSLGTSGVLERFDYGKTNMGCSHWRHMILTPNALYWVDAINQSMFQYTKGPEEISIMKGMSNWFKENIVEAGDANYTITIDGAMHLYYDPEYREVYVVDNTQQFGLVYNEMTQSYLTFTDNQPYYAINYLEKVIGTSGRFHQYHRHNDFAGARGNIYGNYRTISVTLLINPSVNDIGIFNNFEWLTESLVSDVDTRDTFDHLTMWNDYQHTGEIELISGQNIKRRMRTWRYTIPRAVYESHQGVQGPALDERYARMRDTHLFAKFAYTNDDPDKRLVIHDIQTFVTVSNN